MQRTIGIHQGAMRTRNLIMLVIALPTNCSVVLHRTIEHHIRVSVTITGIHSQSKLHYNDHIQTFKAIWGRRSIYSQSGLFPFPGICSCCYLLSGMGRETWESLGLQDCFFWYGNSNRNRVALWLEHSTLGEWFYSFFYNNYNQVTYLLSSFNHQHAQD